MEKTADTLTDSKRGTALGAKNELQDKLTINVSNEDSKWEISFLTFFASICVEYVSVSVACFLRRLAMTLMCHWWSSAYSCQHGLRHMHEAYVLTPSVRVRNQLLDAAQPSQQKQYLQFPTASVHLKPWQHWLHLLPLLILARFTRFTMSESSNQANFEPHVTSGLLFKVRKGWDGVPHGQHLLVMTLNGAVCHKMTCWHQWCTKEVPLWTWNTNLALSTFSTTDSTRAEGVKNSQGTNVSKIYKTAAVHISLCYGNLMQL